MARSVLCFSCIAAAFAGSQIPGCDEFEKDWDLPGGDYSVSQVNSTDCVMHNNCPCEKACQSDPHCHSWTLVPGVKCCLKGNVPLPRQRTGSGFFSGVKVQYKPSCGKAPTPPPPGPPAPPHVGPLACQDNAQQPMLPTYHIIGNVTQNTDGSIKLEPINDASGVTYYKGLYHVWHQCCQNHFDHAISKDLIHWQRLPPPIDTMHDDRQRTYDGSVSMLSPQDGGPVILYDSPDRIPKGWPGCGECMLSLARLNDTNDKYLKTFTRDPDADPVKLDLGGQKPIDFPSTIWKNGNHYNFIAQGGRFTTTDKSFKSWSRVAADMVGCQEHGGQWWIPTPNQVGGAPPPAGTPNYLVNCGGGDSYRIGNYFPGNESFVFSGKTARLEYGHAGWWGAQGGSANNNRMMMIGWVRDFHGEAGPGINFLTRLSALREVNWDVKTQNLVSNPVPELVGLRSKSLTSTTTKLSPANVPHVVPNTGNGAASSSDIVMRFSGFSTNSSTTLGACVLGNGHNASGIGITITVTPSSSSPGQLAAKIQAGACQVGHGHQLVDQETETTQLFDESELTVRVLADRSVADWFVQGGRWAASEGWQSEDPRRPEDSNVLVWSGDSAVSVHIDVYQMGCGWLNPSYTENPTLATIDSDGDVTFV